MSKLKTLAKQLKREFIKSASEMEVDELKEEQRELFNYREVTQDLPRHKLLDSDKARVIFAIDTMILHVGNEILIKEGRI